MWHESGNHRNKKQIIYSRRKHCAKYPLRAAADRPGPGSLPLISGSSRWSEPLGHCQQPLGTASEETMQPHTEHETLTGEPQSPLLATAKPRRYLLHVVSVLLFGDGDVLAHWKTRRGLWARAGAGAGYGLRAGADYTYIRPATHENKDKDKTGTKQSHTVSSRYGSYIYKPHRQVAEQINTHSAYFWMVRLWFWFCLFLKQGST